MTADDDLPFVRPPHLRWTGSSRGDLAAFACERDPDARVVTFQTDSRGFRNGVEGDQAAVVFIGDSYTEAGNVPEAETFVALTGRRLGLSVRNLGMPRQTPPSELVILKKHGLNFHPRTVVWQIAEPNDLNEAVDFRDWENSGRPRYVPGGKKALSRAEAWKRRSPCRRIFKALLPPPPWPLSGTFRDAGGHTHRVLFYPVLPGAEQSPDGHLGWPIIRAAIVEGAAILKERNIKLVVMLIPMKVRVMADSVRFDEVSLEVNGRQQKFTDRLPQGWDLLPDATVAFFLKNLCEQMHVPFVDTTAELKRRAMEGDLVFLPMDTHLSPRGHQAVSDLLVEALSEKAKP